MSYNKYSYAYANPLKFLDPSGMITVGQAEEANEIVAKLRTKYNVRIEKDWGYRESLLLMVPEPVTVGCDWIEGNWRSLRELRLIKQTVTRIATRMGGESKFVSATGTTTITRLDQAGYAMAVPWPARYLVGDLRIPNSLFDQGDGWIRYILAHELAHKWDFKEGYELSKGMMKALGTWICDNTGGNCHWEPYARNVDPITLDVFWERPAGVKLSCKGEPPDNCAEPYALTYGLSAKQPWEGMLQYYRILPGIEDWAESFANYIYPNYYPSIGYSGLVPDGIRETYVRKQIESLP